jgi:hypothetical protein
MQAKGSFKGMTDRVAERLDEDIILPASPVKPEYKGKPTLLKWPAGEIPHAAIQHSGALQAKIPHARQRRDGRIRFHGRRCYQDQLFWGHMRT